MNAFTRATDVLTSVFPFRNGKQKGGPRISPMAVVDPRAIIGDGCEIGPFCIVGPEVVLGTGNKLLSHVVVTGHTIIGNDNVFHPHSVIGGAPQDKKHSDSPTGLEIGDRNHFRENVTIHTGTEYGGKVFGGGVTRVGSDNLLMVNCHIAHDVQVGSRCIFANNIMIAGHVVFGNNVVLNGGVGINQFVSVGDFAYIAGYAQCHHDVPPYCKISDDGDVRSLNSVGLIRGGVSEADVNELEAVVRKLFLQRTPQSVALKEVEQNITTPQIRQLVEFLHRRNSGKHGRYMESLRALAK